MRRVAATASALLAALALAACGEAPEDEAREDGERIGEQLRAVFDATSVEEAQAALDGLRTAAEDVSEDTRDRVQAQIDTQRTSLETAIAELASGDVDGAKAAAQEIRAQADSFSSGNDSISNEFWRGFEEGYDG